MKSPSLALVWELWQKNRWGFALLGVLLGIGAALSYQVGRLKAEEERLWAGLPLTIQGGLSGSNVLRVGTAVRSPLEGMPQRYGIRPGPGKTSVAVPRPEPVVGPPQNVRFQLGSVTIHDGLIRPRDVLAWSSVAGKEGVVRFTLNGSNLYEGPLKGQSSRASQGASEKIQRRYGIPSSPSNQTSTLSVPRLGIGSRSEPGLVEATNADGVSTPSAAEDGDTARSGTAMARPAGWRLEVRADEHQGVLTWVRSDGGRGSVALVMEREAPWELSELASRRSTWCEAAIGWTIALLGMSFLVLCAILGGAEPHAARGFSGLPPRRFTLPVRTVELVFWPLGLGVMSVWLLYAAWARLVFPLLVAENVSVPHGSLAMLLAAGLVSFQALVWGLPSFPRLRTTLITLLVLGLAGSVAASFANIKTGSPDNWVWLWRVVPIAFGLVTAAAAAWFGVRLERRGYWASWQGWGAGDWSPLVLPGQSEGFGAGLRAQLWLEWRRNARLPLWFWTVGAVVLLGLALVVPFGMPMSMVMGGMLSAVWILVPAWLAIAGLNLARDGGTRQLALSPFSASRPIPTESLLLAKLWAGGLLWLCAVGVAALVVVILRAAWFLRSWPDALSTLVVLAMSLHLFTGIFPLCLSGRIPGFPWSLAPLVLVYGVALNVVFWYDRHPEAGSIFFGVLVALVIVKLLLGCWGFRRSLSLRLVSRRFVAGYAGLWLVGTGLLAILTFRNRGGVLGEDHAPGEVGSLVLLPAALLMVPWARIAVSPLALARNRHR